MQRGNTKKEILHRLSYCLGHVHGIENMVKEGRDCSDVLIQISAVDSALKKIKAILLQEYIGVLFAAIGG